MFSYLALESLEALEILPIFDTLCVGSRRTELGKKKDRPAGFGHPKDDLKTDPKRRRIV